MSAILICRPSAASAPSIPPRYLLALILLSVFAAAVSGGAQPANDFAAQTERTYVAAQKRFLAQPTNDAAAWDFGRACFDWADFATNSAARAVVAQQGIAVCRQLAAHDPRSAPAHYYLGMNLGQLARTKLLGALKIVNEMEHEFLAAEALDERFDFAGPDRNLGLLYLEAPTIGSVGSRAKARRHLQRAVQLAPEYPENHLSLIEAYLKWDDRISARRALKALDALLPAARGRFSGQTWTQTWKDWESRLAAARGKIEEPVPKPNPKS